jgi:hypothetical protein
MDISGKAAKQQGIEEIRNQQTPQQYRKVGNMLKIRGLQLYEVNIKELTVEPAKYKTKDTVLLNTGNVKPGKEVICTPDCIYIQVLNDKNAKRKAIWYLSRMKK